MKHKCTGCLQNKKQYGAAIIEFAFILPLFILLLLGIFEFGRIFYLLNTLQEVTRHAAREQVVSLASSSNAIRSNAIFGGAHLPAGAEISSAEIIIKFYPDIDSAIEDDHEITTGLSPASQMQTCGPDGNSGDLDCAKFAKISINNVEYDPMVGLFEGGRLPWLGFVNLRITLPPSTVIMPIESFGYLR